VRLLGKPVAECHALCVPTAQWGHPMCGPASVRGFVAAEPTWRHFSGLGWASLGVLELTALPTIGAQRWVPWVREADALLVDGGDATYLCHWMRESGLADLPPSLPDTVWVGVSAGSRPAFVTVASPVSGGAADGLYGGVVEVEHVDLSAQAYPFLVGCL